MTPKTQASLIHFRRRLRERYNMDINSKGIARIVKDIQRNRAEHLRTQSKRISVWRVSIYGSCVVVVYDRKRKIPVTALRRSYDLIR